MGVHELDQVLANAAAAVDDSRRCATCSVQQRSRGSRGSGKTFDGGTAYSRLSASDHRRKDAQCIRYASGGSPNMRGLATRASWASTCLAGASRVESLLLYAESPPATYFGAAICARRRHLGSAAVSAVPDHGACKT